MLRQQDQELVNRIRQVLSQIDKTVTLYKKELRQGRFRPKSRELWERTAEKQVVEVAITELQKLSEGRSLKEMCRLVDETEEFAEKARVVDV